MNGTESESGSGSIGMPEAGAGRAAVAAEIAGVLAECGVVVLTVCDPRACREREVRAGKTDLPAEITGAVPGTTLSGRGVALLIDERELRWVAEGPVAEGLRRLGEIVNETDRGSPGAGPRA